MRNTPIKRNQFSLKEDFKDTSSNNKLIDYRCIQTSIVNHYGIPFFYFEEIIL